MGDPLWFSPTTTLFYMFFLTIPDYMCLVLFYIFSFIMHIKKSLFLKTWNKSLRT